MHTTTSEGREMAILLLLPEATLHLCGPSFRVATEDSRRMDDPERRGERETSEGSVRMGREVRSGDGDTITSFSTLTTHTTITIFPLPQSIAMIDIFIRYGAE